MQVQVRAVNFTADHKLVRFIENKLDKLTLFHDQIISSEVFLKLDNTTTENKTAEILLAIPGKELFAKRSDKSFEGAADAAVEALRRQIRKEKTKLQKAAVGH